jgi:hypothetical protein
MPDIVARYTGKERDEEAYAGIPRRDLVQEDLDKLQDDQRKLVLEGDVYRVLKNPVTVYPESEVPTTEVT